MTTLDETLRLETLSDYGVLDADDDLGLHDLARLASHVCETPVSLITFIDRERQWFKAAVGTEVSGTSREDSFCTHVITAGGTLVVGDTLEDARFAESPFVHGERGIRFFAGAPLKAPNGQILGSVCVVDQRPRELTSEQLTALEALSRQVMVVLELRRRIARNERASTALRTAEKLAAVGNMASSVAHEINNPLQSVTNLLFMVTLAEGDAERGEYLRMAQEELTRVTQIVTQTLRFHHQLNHAATIRLSEITDSILLLYRTRLTHAGAMVEVRDRQTVPLLCYVDDVRQVVASLVANARDALASQKYGLLRIRLADGRDQTTGKRGTVLTVADTGSGFAPEIFARLYQPFNTSKGIGGTGLGLWVAKGVLDKHGATIRLRTRSVGAHTGTVVRIFFPPEPVLTVNDTAESFPARSLD